MIVKYFHRRDAEHAEDLFYFFLCDLCVLSEAGGLCSLTYPHSIAWTISIAKGLRD